MAASKLKGINVIAPEEGDVFLLFEGCCVSFNYVIQTQKPLQQLSLLAEAVNFPVLLHL